MLLAEGVGDDDQEELDDGLAGLLFSTHVEALLLDTALLANVDIVSEVRVDGVFEVLDGRPVVEGDDVTVVNEDVKPVGLRETVELVLQVLSVFNILLQAENGPLLEINWLANNLAQYVRVL